MIFSAVDNPVNPFGGHVELRVSGVLSYAVSVTVQRTAQGRTVDVRDAIDMRTDGAMFARDFEVGFGVPSVYNALARDADGIVVESIRSGPVMLKSQVSGSVTIHDPIRPRDALTLTLRGSAAQSGVRPLVGDAIEIPGRSAPIVMAAGRQGWSGLAFDVYTYTEDQSARLDALLGGYDSDDASGVLCFRVTENLPQLIPRTFFGRVTQPSVSWVRIGDMLRGDWSLTTFEVAPPAPAIVEPIVTWADAAEYWNARGGWAAFNAAYTTPVAVTEDLRPGLPT